MAKPTHSTVFPELKMSCTSDWLPRCRCSGARPLCRNSASNPRVAPAAARLSTSRSGPSAPDRTGSCISDRQLAGSEAVPPLKRIRPSAPGSTSRRTDRLSPPSKRQTPGSVVFPCPRNAARRPLASRGAASRPSEIEEVACRSTLFSRRAVATAAPDGPPPIGASRSSVVVPAISKSGCNSELDRVLAGSADPGRIGFVHCGNTRLLGSGRWNRVACGLAAVRQPLSPAAAPLGDFFGVRPFGLACPWALVFARALSVDSCTSLW
eukprot:SAG11_NODE_129_length_15500_cov_16.145250_15_plen_266_part_00